MEGGRVGERTLRKGNERRKQAPREKNKTRRGWENKMKRRENSGLKKNNKK